MKTSGQIKEAVGILRAGGVIVFPTDTVWGVGAAISSPAGLEKLYQVKGRDDKKPTAVLVANTDMASKYGHLNHKAIDLVNKHWPGGLTVVVQAKSTVPSKVLGTKDTVGLRAPNHQLIQNMINELGEGLVATSANFAGGSTPVTKSEIDADFLNTIDFVLDGEDGKGLASTVVDVSGEELVVLRQGEIEIEK